VELLLLGIDPVWLEKLAAEGGATGPVELVPRFHFTDPLLKMLLERLVAGYAGPGPADALYAQSLVQAAAAVVLRVAGKGSAVARREGGLSPRRLAEVVDFIHANLSQRVTLADLATVAGVSESHFTRVFRASTGESPHRYVMQRRLEHARRELALSSRPIAEIATEAGFADQSHLTRREDHHDRDLAARRQHGAALVLRGQQGAGRALRACPDSVAYHKSSAMNGDLTKIEDIVPWVTHLLTDGWWANGQTLFLNGGYTTR